MTWRNWLAQLTSAGCSCLVCTTDVEIFGVKLPVLWKIVIFLGHEHSLTEEILVDLLAVGFWNKPGISFSIRPFAKLVSTYIVASSWRYSGNREQFRAMR